MSTPIIIIAIADYRRDTDQHLRELGRELDDIKDSLQHASEQEICQYRTIAEATPAKIAAAFNDAGDAVVGFHFSGHNGGYDLLLNDETSIEAEHLAAFLGKQPSLQFVFLNACATYNHTKSLHAAGVKAVISTAQNIEDKLAREVATRFYQELGKGKSLAHAFQYFQTQFDLQGQQGKMRGIALDADHDPGFNEYPWQISYQEGAKAVSAQWSLSRAAGNPLFSLPPIPDYYELPEKPFRYLERYEQEHARIFFGRAREIRQMHDLLTQKGLPPILLFYGQSGVGKSSIMAAGLIPRLEKDNTIIYRRRDPVQGLVSDLEKSLQVKDGEDFAAAWKAIEAKEKKPLFIILDQVEECFTRAQAQENELIALYLKVKSIFADPKNRPAGKLILAYRKEYHPDISELLKAQALPFSELFLQRMDEEGIVNAVTGLTTDKSLQQHYRLSIEEDLPFVIANDLVRDLSGSVAPVLQVLLSKLWDRAKKEDGDPHFGEEPYFRIRQSGLLLSDFLQERLKFVKQEHPEASKSGLVLDLLYFFTTDRATADQHSTAQVIDQYADRKSQIRALLQTLSDNYLLLFLPDASGGQWRLAHDTLAPFIRAMFLQSDVAGQQALRILENNPADRADQTELNASQLRILDQGRSGMRQWTAAEEALIQGSRKTVLRQARIKRFFQISMGIAALLLIGLLFSLYRSAEQKNRALESRLLINEATTLARTDPTQAIALYQQSLEKQPDPAVEDRMYELIANYPQYQSVWIDSTLTFDAASFSPDGRQMITAQSDEGLLVAVKRWGQGDQGYTLSDSLVGASLDLRTLAVNNEGTVIGGATNHRVYRWNRIGKFDGEYDILDNIQAVALHPDGQQSAWGYASGTMLLDLESRQRDSIGNNYQVTDLAYTANGQQLLQADDKGLVRAFALSPPNSIVIWEQDFQAPITDIAIEPTKNLLAVGTTQGKIHLLQLTESGAEEITNFEFESKRVSKLFFDPLGRWLAAGYTTGEIRVWSLEQYGGYRPLLGHRSTILALHANADHHITSLSAGGKLLRWSLHDESSTSLLHTDFGTFSSMEMDQDGKRLVLGGNDYKAYTYDLDRQQKIQSYTKHTDRVSSVAFASTGDLIISGDRSRAIHLWNAQSGDTLHRQTGQHKSFLLALAAADEKWISADQDGKIILWSKDLQQAEKSITTSSAISAMWFISETKQLLAVGADSSVFRWTLAEDSPTKDLYHPESILTDIAYDPQQKELWIIGRSATLYHWTMSGDLLATYSWPGNKRATALSYHPDGRLAIATEEGDIGFYDAQGHRYYELNFGRPIDDLLFSKDGKFLYGCSVDYEGTGVLLRWNVPMPRQF